MGINGLIHVNTFVEYENNRLLLPMALELWWGSSSGKISHVGYIIL